MAEYYDCHCVREVHCLTITKPRNVKKFACNSQGYVIHLVVDLSTAKVSINYQQLLNYITIV